MDFHPVIVATGQIISRLQLTWKGHTTNSNTPQATTSAFYRLYALACVYWIFRVLNFAIVAFLDSSADEEPSNWYYFVCALDDILWYGYFAFCIYVLKNIRCVYLFVCVCVSICSLVWCVSARYVCRLTEPFLFLLVTTLFVFPFMHTDPTCEPNIRYQKVIFVVFRMDTKIVVVLWFVRA